LDLDLLAAIQDLSPKQRAVVTLYYLEDWPAAEIAEVVDCSVSTVSVHLHRARIRLAEILGEEVESDVR
jgi:RNA polymerase sigma-70 factor (ECF subfamily)